MTRHNWPIETRAYVDNLLAVYALATDADIKAGKVWYSAARGYALRLARKHGVSLQVAAGVISALSPGTEWSRNKRNADEFIGHWRLFREAVLSRLDLTTYGRRPLTKAYAILTGSDIERTLNGDKTVAFYRSIVDPTQTSTVVIDGHAKSAALGVRVGNHDGHTDAGNVGTSGVKVNQFEYPHLERSFLNAAREVGLLPSQFQAIVWLVWKRQPIGFNINHSLRAMEKAA